MKRIDKLLQKNLKRLAKERGFDPKQYKRGWYQVGRRLKK